MQVETLDLRFQGSPHVIAAFLLRGPRGQALVESGPGSTLAELTAALARHGLKPGDIGDVLLTHIHLDHAGAAGWWARQGARVWVHPLGAPHLIDPSKLIASATRIYGDRMERLWGEILPAPEENVRVVEDGARLDIAGLTVEVVESPGHARHHHAYAIDDALFTGDAAGIMLPHCSWIDLPAPPPEFDLEAWKATLDRLRERKAHTIYRTHFGPSGNPAAELDRFESLLDRATGWIRELLAAETERQALIDDFSARMRQAALATGDDATHLRAYELANPRVMSVDGISRYWRKKQHAS